MTDRGALLVFTKPAKAGRVKTRLIGDLTAQQAAELHEAFLQDLLERLRGRSFELEVAWALEDGEEPPDLGLPARCQHGDTLGDRLFNALSEAGVSHSYVAAVGSDHPQLEAETVEAAFRALRESADVVLGPASDGGYFLVGVRTEALDPALFSDVPWSTGNVLSDTLERCENFGLRTFLLPPGHDVDTPADLARLASELPERETPCPRTSALLAAWGRLGSGAGAPTA